MIDIAIRPARADDREAVLAFCAEENRHDFIMHVWEDWLHDPRGQLLVATVSEQPVGIIHMQMLSEHDAWLEGIRVAPAYRRQGIARLLDVHAMREAQRRGAAFARLIVDASNEPGIHLVESLRLDRVGSRKLYSAPPLSVESKWKRSKENYPRLATLDDLDEIISYLDGSNIFPLLGGLYMIDFTAYPITVELLKEKIAEQQLYLLRRWERIDGLAIAEQEEDNFSLGYIDGTTIETISLLADDLRNRARTRIRAFVPELVMVHNAFSGVGYEAQDVVFYMYEKSL